MIRQTGTGSCSTRRRTEQLHALDRRAPRATRPALDAILLTHAHIGHYTGLMHLGREVMGEQGLPVWVKPRMAAFLSSNGPWEQLVALGNIALQPLPDVDVALGRLRVRAFAVPHRDEYSETVGFVLTGVNTKALYLPDIDKWDRWDVRIEELLATVDVAYIDGTFFADGELPGRSMAEIPHPFVSETMARLGPLPASERAKVRFIHLNHTNPLLDPNSAATRAVRDAGFGVAIEGEVWSL